jgi:hypothetical protein
MEESSRAPVPQPIPSDDLILSFGWTKEDCKTQHDAHEFLLKFLEKLDERLEYFGSPDRLSDLFRGSCQTTTASPRAVTVQEEPFCCFGITFGGRSKTGGHTNWSFLCYRRFCSSNSGGLA